MVGLVQKLVKNIQAFDARGILVQPGHVGMFDPEGLKSDDVNFSDVGSYEPAIIEVAAIAPTGPNPQVPQQIPPDAIQGAGGGYEMPGKILVAEGNAPAAAIDPAAEAKVTDIMAEAVEGGATSNDDDALVAGTVAEITAGLGGKTDDELKALQAAEADREKPRVGVTRAIEAELDSRAKATA